MNDVELANVIALRAKVKELETALSVRIARVEPGDVIVLNVSVQLDEVQIQEYQAAMKRLFPNNHTTIIGPGGSLEIVRPVSEGTAKP